MTEETITFPKLIISVVLAGAFTGLIMSFVLIALLISLVNDTVTDLEEKIQGLEIDCSEDYNPAANTIKLGEDIYYCLIRENQGGEKKG